MTTSPVPKSASPAAAQTMGAPKVGIVSLGCPKALVDSERILTRLRAEGYEISPSYDGADVVLGRAVLHHVPMAEYLLGRLRAALRPGTRIGFLEPDFRRPLAKLAHAEASGRPELAPLLVFAKMMNDLYAAWRISPAVGASLAPALADAGYSNVRHAWHPFATDESVLENMRMIYDEVRETLAALNILGSNEIDEQQKLLGALEVSALPPVWGLHQVTALAP